MSPRAIVAIILAMCVLVFFVAGTVLPVVFQASTHKPPNTELAALWADVIKVLIGGLIGYAVGTDGDTK